MSEIDLKDLNLGQELAISEVQSVSGRQSNPDRQSFQGSGRFDHFPLLPPAPHKSNNPNYRLSETVNYRRPLSIYADTARPSLRDDSEPGSARERQGGR